MRDTWDRKAARDVSVEDLAREIKAAKSPAAGGRQFGSEEEAFASLRRLLALRPGDAASVVLDGRTLRGMYLGMNERREFCFAIYDHASQKLKGAACPAWDIMLAPGQTPSGGG